MGSSSYRAGHEMIRRLLLLVLSLGFAMVCGELVIRYVARAWPFEAPLFVPAHLTARDEPLRWRFSGKDGRNSLGLRNREVGPKEAGTVRILFLGDSLLWSGETSSGELYPQVVERRLNSRPSSAGTRYEVVNAGVPGYTTFQELKFLEIHGLDMEPDLVVLGFVLNDLHHPYLHRPTERRVLDGEPTTRLTRFDPASGLGVALGRSYLAHEVVWRGTVIWRRIAGRPLFPFERRLDVHLAWRPYGWRHADRLIGEMEALLAARDVAFAMMVFPVSDQVKDRYRKLDEEFVLRPQRTIRSIAERDGIPLLDLTEPIYRNGGARLFRDYLHLGAEGNDLVAEQVEGFLVRALEPDRGAGTG